uniref:Uncharacterized protein n=1 Tax=Anguilla anguilla TaxID=7936 RepID=A0A0E9XGN4_ANGAN
MGVCSPVFPDFIFGHITLLDNLLLQHHVLTWQLPLWPASSSLSIYTSSTEQTCIFPLTVMLMQFLL